jgi:Holliday junction resolvase RusA-like endonuclease
MKIFIHLCILGDPKPQPRHRHYWAFGHSNTYDPAKADKGTFASIVQRDAPAEPLNCPIMLEINFFMGRPKGHYGVGKNAYILKPNAPEWHTSRPDLDNLEKFVKDALNKIYWKDDSIICQTICRKIYSDRTPRTEINIESLL